MKFQFATILGVVLVSTLIIASGMYVYTSAQSTIQDTTIDMSTQEIEAFNSNFMIYGGKQTGSLVKALIQRLIANAKVYEEEPEKIPSVKYVTSEDDNSDAKDWQESDEGGKVTSKEDDNWKENYSKALQTLSSGLEAKHTYFIEIKTGDKGLISEIIIHYDSNNVEYDDTDDNSSDEYDDDIDDSNGEYEDTEFTTQEIQAFNSNFTTYEGKQTGSQVKVLIQRLIANAKTYRREPSKIPSVEYVTSDNDKTDAKDWQESDDGGKATSKEDDNWKENYSKALQVLLNCLHAKHTYFVEINTGDKGYVNEVIIYYDKGEE